MSPMLDPEARTWLDNLLAAIAAAEAGPIEADLAATPRIEFWLPIVSSSSFPAFWGHVAGTESFITTSQLIHLDAEAGWARTEDSWYRLGKSFRTLQMELLRCSVISVETPGCISFELPGFAAVDPDRLDGLLTAQIAAVRALDAEDLAARKAEGEH